MAPPISRFPVPDPGELPDDMRGRILAVQDQVAVNYLKADLTPRHKAMLDFALSNRMANLTGMRPNDEFYSMGR